MSQTILSQKTQSNLEALKQANILADFYPAGGTGLALQLKHRKSIDLDFFTENEIETSLLIRDLKEVGSFVVENEAENTLEIDFQGTRITFLNYDYPLLCKLKKIQDIEVADLKDIGCMKISAISSRGSKKDFIDVYFITKEISLSRLLELFEKKYKEINYTMPHILKSLTYFEQAESEPMPEMIKEANWEQVKEFFETEAPKINSA